MQGEDCESERIDDEISKNSQFIRSRTNRMSKASITETRKLQNTEHLWQEFNKSFEAHNQKDLFVKAFAHHVSTVLRKKQIVQIKHRGGFVGGPSPEL